MDNQVHDRTPLLHLYAWVQIKTATDNLPKKTYKTDRRRLAAQDFHCRDGEQEASPLEHRIGYSFIPYAPQVIAHPARQPDRPRSCAALTPPISVAAQGGL
jgi:hypothetical protein